LDAYFIRPETAEDRTAIRALTAEAFEGHPYSAGTEPAIVDGLRAAGALALSLVAVTGEGEVMGHAAFSPLTVDGREGRWFGVGPVSVKPALQRRGIGSARRRDGIRRLQELRADGCVLVGDPGYYGRFGFKADRQAAGDGLPPDHTMSLGFDGLRPGGPVRFHPAFGV
jgi:putative acetyltransferase